MLGTSSEFCSVNFLSLLVVIGFVVVLLLVLYCKLIQPALEIVGTNNDDKLQALQDTDYFRCFEQPLLRNIRELWTIFPPRIITHIVWLCLHLCSDDDDHVQKFVSVYCADSWWALVASQHRLKRSQWSCSQGRSSITYFYNICRQTWCSRCQKPC